MRRVDAGGRVAALRTERDALRTDRERLLRSKLQALLVAREEQASTRHKLDRDQPDLDAAARAWPCCGTARRASPARMRRWRWTGAAARRR